MGGRVEGPFTFREKTSSFGWYIVIEYFGDPVGWISPNRAYEPDLFYVKRKNQTDPAFMGLDVETCIMFVLESARSKGVVKEGYRKRDGG